jgi:hypothetical protein
LSRTRWLVAAGFSLLAGCGLTMSLLGDPLPQSSPDASADGLARGIEASVDAAAWSNTGAVAWTFAGSNEHLWDRERHLVRVRWRQKEVLLDLTKRTGRATVRGEAVWGERAEGLFEDAYARWANDSFWLNPLVKLFDEGTTRAVVDQPGAGSGLLVTYASGGVTPGDSYLWLLGEDGRPSSVRMWVSVIPIGGLSVSWDGWEQLSTGAWVATRHRGRVGPELVLSGVSAAATLSKLTGGEDPFAPLFEE